MDMDQFKSAMGRFGTGITVITGRATDGSFFGFTANSFTSLSLEPPLVLFCLKSSSPLFPLFSKSPDFAVNILGSEQRELSGLFAQSGGDKFRELPLRHGLIGAPLLKGCLANLECGTREILPGGDHGIFVGEVKEVHLGKGEPLLYYCGQYRTF